MDVLVLQTFQGFPLSQCYLKSTLALILAHKYNIWRQIYLDPTHSNDRRCVWKHLKFVFISSSPGRQPSLPDMEFLQIQLLTTILTTARHVTVKRKKDNKAADLWLALSPHRGLPSVSKCDEKPLLSRQLTWKRIAVTTIDPKNHKNWRSTSLRQGLLWMLVTLSGQHKMRSLPIRDPL